MDDNQFLRQRPPPPPIEAPPPRAAGGGKLKKTLGPIGAGIAALLTKFKFALFFLAKYGLLILKTGGTMLLSIGVYALFWGVWFAVGFVVLLFVHECGHLLVAKKFGLKVGAPMFIPFIGALIMLKEQPRNAWVEASVGIGGPILGSVGALACEGLFLATGNPIFQGLAYTGFFLNLFNLMPVGFLDGGRIVTAISPWIWLIGFGVLLTLTVFHPNFLLILITITSLPRLFSLFRPKTEAERRYFEVTRGQRILMSVLYFGLIVALVAGMQWTYINRESLSRHTVVSGLALQNRPHHQISEN